MSIDQLQEHLLALNREREVILDALEGLDVTEYPEKLIKRWMEVVVERDECISQQMSMTEKANFIQIMSLLNVLLQEALSLKRVNVVDDLKRALKLARTEVDMYCHQSVASGEETPQSSHTPCCTCCLLPLANKMPAPTEDLSRMLLFAHKGLREEDELSVGSSVSSQTRRKRRQVAKEFLTVAFAGRDIQSSILGQGILERSGESDNDTDNSLTVEIDD